MGGGVIDQYCNSQNNGVFFIGLSKDREERILLLKNKFDELGIKNKIIIIDQNKPDYRKLYMPYNQVLMEAQNSEVLLDIVAGEQSGATQRELEALYFRKKLITDNQNIKSRNYFNQNNIFLIDYSKDNILEGIETFLEKPFEDASSEVKEYYTIENWINRFIE
jgi:UDP-N-acetylglucosamine 2-epimerase